MKYLYVLRVKSMLMTDVGDGLSSNTHGQDYFDLLKYGNVFIIFSFSENGLRNFLDIYQ